MSFRSEVREFIEKETSKKQLIALFISEIADLRKQNKDLMDRLMAKNFTELKTYQSEDEPGTVSLTAKDLELDEDENNVGEIVNG